MMAADDSSWHEVREAWASALRDGGDDPWAAPPLPTLGAVRAFHTDADGTLFVASIVSVASDGVLLTMWIDGHPYLLRHDDFLRLLAEADAL